MAQKQAGRSIKKWINTDEPSRRTEKNEFPRGGKGVIICSTCKAAYFKKRWVQGLEKIGTENQNLAVAFKLCPACTQIKNKQFEGQITIKNIPQKYESEIINFTNAYGRRASDRDPMDRVIATKKTKDGFIITTTENQLALKLSRKLKQMFHQAVKDISFSPGPSDVVYITISFH